MNDKIILSTGVLKDGTAYDIVLLQPDQAQDSYNLHNEVINALPPEEKGFILPKSLDWFKNHMHAHSSSAVIGIMVQGKLIGQAVIHHPTKNKPGTGMVDMDLPAGPPESFSVLQAVSIHPEYRGQHLMNRLVQEWIFLAQSLNKTHLLAEIETRNVASWNSFLKAGLNIVSIGRDPSDGTVVYNAYEAVPTAVKRQLTPEFNRQSQHPDAECPVEAVEEQKTLMKQGYVAVAFRKATGTLVLKKLPANDGFSLPKRAPA